MQRSNRSFPMIALLLAALVFGALFHPARTAAQYGDKVTKNKATFMSYVEVYNQGNVEALATLLAPDYIEHDPGGTTMGAADIPASIVAFRNALPDMHVTVDVLIGEGDWTASHLTLTGTFQNEFVTPDGAIPPTGQPFQVRFITLDRYNDQGLIVEDFSENDQLTFLTQFGVFPAPEGGAAPAAELPAMTLDTTITGLEEANKQTVRDLIDQAFNQGNLAIMDSALSPDYVSYDVNGEVDDLAGFKDFITTWRAAMPDFKATVDIQLAENDWAASRFTVTGTFTNPLVSTDGSQLPPTGQPVTLTLNVLHHFNAQGQDTVDFVGEDSLTLFTQLGILGAPEGGDGAAAAPAEVVVNIQNFAFDPSPLTIPVGTTVRFVNNDGAPHTATADDGSFDTGRLDSTQEATVTFSQAGTFVYHCEFHGASGGQGMSATIIVQ